MGNCARIIYVRIHGHEPRRRALGHAAPRYVTPRRRYTLRRCRARPSARSTSLSISLYLCLSLRSAVIDSPDKEDINNAFCAGTHSVCSYRWYGRAYTFSPRYIPRVGRMILSKARRSIIGTWRVPTDAPSLSEWILPVKSRQRTVNRRYWLATRALTTRRLTAAAFQSFRKLYFE